MNILEPILATLLGVVIGVIFISIFNKRYFILNHFNKLFKRNKHKYFREFFNFRGDFKGKIEYQEQGFNESSLIVRNSLNQIIFEIVNNIVYVNIEYFILFEIENEHLNKEQQYNLTDNLLLFLKDDLKVIKSDNYNIHPRTKTENCDFLGQQKEIDYYYKNIRKDKEIIKQNLNKGKLHLSNIYNNNFIKLHDAINHQDFRIKISEDEKFLNLSYEQGINHGSIKICGFNNNYVFEQGETPPFLKKLNVEERNYKYLRFIETKVITCYNQELLKKVESICNFRPIDMPIVLSKEDLYEANSDIEYAPRTVYNGKQNSFYFPVKNAVDVSFID